MLPALQGRAKRAALGGRRSRSRPLRPRSPQGGPSAPAAESAERTARSGRRVRKADRPQASALHGRVERLREKFASADLDALLVSQPESRYYLSGYTGHDLPPRDSAGYLLITRERCFLLTDSRTTEQAEHEAPDYEVLEYGIKARLTQRLAELVRAHGLRRVGVEAIHLPHHSYQQIADILRGNAELVPTSDLVDQLRIAKDEAELASLRTAQERLDDCFAHVSERLRPGMTERKVARMVEDYLREHADGPSFPSIIASGPNASMPHAVASDRQIQPREPITIDIGALYQGYCSDMTRTVCLGSAPDKLKEIYGIVLRAQEETEAALRPGMTGKQADAIARDVITAAGHGDHFGHGTGHGIGLEVHEPPWVSSTKGENELQPGMVFSVEPGIYLPGWGGVRIEDLVLMTDNGAEVLARSHKRLEIDSSAT
jgi:Xaa-Pro aminopeptidase